MLRYELLLLQNIFHDARRYRRCSRTLFTSNASFEGHTPWINSTANAKENTPYLILLDWFSTDIGKDECGFVCLFFYF